MKRFDNLLHCDIRLFLHKFQNIVVLFFCKNCFPASQLRSGLITASACTLFYKAVYGAFISWKIFCNFPGIMSFIPGLQYQFSSFICKGTALFKRFAIEAASIITAIMDIRLFAAEYFDHIRKPPQFTGKAFSQLCRIFTLLAKINKTASAVNCTWP